MCVCERKQFDNIDNLLHRGQTRFLIMPSANISINLASLVSTKRYAGKGKSNGNSNVNNRQLCHSHISAVIYPTRAHCVQGILLFSIDIINLRIKALRDTKVKDIERK